MRSRRRLGYWPGCCALWVNEMPGWGLDAAGTPVPETVGSIPPDDLGPEVLAELAELLRICGERWVPIGPCLDGGWYAAPRHDRGGARVQGSNLAELRRNLHARERGE
jgi:hypothetical protein